MNLKYLKHFFLYGIFGLLTTIVNILVYKLLLDFRLYYIVSNTLAFIIAVIFAFLTNRKWVFFSSANSLTEKLAEFIRFSIARIAVYFVELGCLILLVEVYDLDKMVGKLVTTFLVVILNYLLSKFAVFRSQRI